MAELAPVYLITGTDRPKVGRALRRLRERIGDDATEILSAQEASGEDAVAACNALGLFAVERRLVIVEEVHRWKAADLKALGEYLPRPAPTSVLVLAGDEVKRDSPLAKAVAKAGEVLVYDLPKRGRKADLPRWVEAHTSPAPLAPKRCQRRCTNSVGRPSSVPSQPSMGRIVNRFAMVWCPAVSGCCSIAAMRCGSASGRCPRSSLPVPRRLPST